MSRRLVALGLGSNLPPSGRPPFATRHEVDPRLSALEGALEALVARGHGVRATSRVVESDAVGVPDEQPPYLNACALIETEASLEKLLSDCLDVEAEAGRSGKGDRAARPLDLDILAAWRVGADGSLRPCGRRDPPRLCVPHARLAERAFAAAPLAELLPDAPLTVVGEEGLTRPRQLAARLAEDVARLRAGPPSPAFPRPS